MKIIKLFTVFSSVIYLTVAVLAEDEIKRDTYPFMAFIYYQDDTILGLSGDRFLQGAVLVRPSFLISSSPESTISKNPLSKTLLSRVGATVVDSKFTLNEDEDEQEQEIIQITRPSKYEIAHWWRTDICLLKTLQPFVSSNAVRFTQLSTKQEPTDKLCHILVFKRKSGTEVRVLTRMLVEMLPSTADTCGKKFVKDTMICSTDPTSSEEEQPGDFCHGNSGGPLICDGDVIALQTYINGHCKAPHLYQLLSPRKKFLDCGIDEKCGSKVDCLDTCTTILKDAPVKTSASTTPATTTMELITSASTDITESTDTADTTESTDTTETAAATEAESTIASDGDSPITTEVDSTITTEVDTSLPTEMNTNTTVETEEPSATTVSILTTTVTNATTHPTTTTLAPSPSTPAWPFERVARRHNDEEKQALNRTISLEAQSQPAKKKSRRSSASCMAAFQSFIYSCFLLCICLL